MLGRMTLKEAPLGQDGIAYVESCLRQGTGLCTRVLDLAFADGDAFAPIPEHTIAERARSFGVGGLIARRHANRWLGEHLQGAWRPGFGGTLVLQDIWANPSDPAVQNSEVKRFFQGANVYYYCEIPDVDWYWIQRAKRAMASYLFIAFYTRSPIRDDELLPDHTVDEALIDRLARSTTEVFVSAYDQEGLVVWRRFIG
jgi:hypothetical protein